MSYPKLTRYTCPRCHHVTLARPHLDRVTCAYCEHVISNEFALARANAALEAHKKALGLADTQPLPCYRDETPAEKIAREVDKLLKR